MKSLKESLKDVIDRHETGIENLFANQTIQYAEIESLKSASIAHSRLCAKTEGSLAKVEARLLVVEERVSKEISNIRIDKQSQSLDFSARKAAFYDNIKARCREIKERLMILD
jgi:hypothetical protein